MRCGFWGSGLCGFLSVLRSGFVRFFGLARSLSFLVVLKALVVVFFKGGLAATAPIPECSPQLPVIITSRH